jgi:hypothetical protein
MVHQQVVITIPALAALADPDPVANYSFLEIVVTLDQVPPTAPVAAVEIMVGHQE